MTRLFFFLLALAIAWTLGVLALVGWFCPCLAEAADAEARFIASSPAAGVSAYVVYDVSGPAPLAGEYPAAADGSAAIMLPNDLPVGTYIVDISACGQAKDGDRPCSAARRFRFPFPSPLPVATGLRVVFRP